MATAARRLRSIDKAVPAELDVHCIVDNCASHKHPKVKAWLAASPRWHMHFIPTYSSWLDQVERFFSSITARAIRRGSFASVKELVAKIDHFVAHCNQNCRPFTWTATADSILAKLGRLCERISGTETLAEHVLAAVDVDRRRCGTSRRCSA